MSEKEIELLEALRKARLEFNEVFQNAPTGMNYSEYMDYMDESSEKALEASRAYRLVQRPLHEVIPDYGDVMSLESFISNCEDGGFIDYDGSGNYIDDGKMTNITIHPSDVSKDCVRKEFSEIIWFNR